MTIAKSYTFTNNTVANPAEVNQNFDDVINAVKANHHSDKRQCRESELFAEQG